MDLGQHASDAAPGAALDIINGRRDDAAMIPQTDQLILSKGLLGLGMNHLSALRAEAPQVRVHFVSPLGASGSKPFTQARW